MGKRQRVMFADNCRPCEMCGDLVCPKCDVHYAECECPGPTQDDEYMYEFDSDDVMWATPRDD